MRLAGAWPDPRHVALDGRALRPGLSFLLPESARNLTLPALAAGPPEDAPPGSVLIWTEAADSPASIDVGALAPEVVDELRDLGYVR